MTVTSTQPPSEPYKVDRDNLPPELRGVTPDALEEAIRNVEKARNGGIARHKRQQEEHDKLVKDGKAINTIEAAKRCYSAGSHGTEELGVKKSG